MRIIPWTISTELDCSMALNLGVHGIIADDPAMVRRVMATRAGR